MLKPPKDAPMTHVATDPTDEDDATAAAEDASGEEDEQVVRKEQDKLRGFVKDLTGDDIKSGSWFAKLIAHALDTYTTKVDWSYFQDKYRGVPADAIVDQRIKMAARYAALEGGLSASAYSAAVVAGLFGAVPVALPAAIVTVMVDVAFTTQLQLRLAYDIAVLYRVPIDIHDPEDLWKLIRVAFTIRSGEAVSEGVLKTVPVFVRPIVRKFYKGAVLQAARGLPIVGKYLLQRNVVKIGIPLVGVPLAVVLNRWTTLVAGRHARLVFRNEARLIELAGRLSKKSRHPASLLWVAWLVVNADAKISDDEAALMRHLLVAVRQDHQLVDDVFSQVVDVQADDVWLQLASEEGDLDDVVDAARSVAECDGPTNAKEKALLKQIGERCEDLREDRPGATAG